MPRQSQSVISSSQIARLKASLKPASPPKSSNREASAIILRQKIEAAKKKAEPQPVSKYRKTAPAEPSKIRELKQIAHNCKVRSILDCQIAEKQQIKNIQLRLKTEIEEKERADWEKAVKLDQKKEEERRTLQEHGAKVIEDQILERHHERQKKLAEHQLEQQDALRRAKLFDAEGDKTRIDKALVRQQYNDAITEMQRLNTEKIAKERARDEEETRKTKLYADIKEEKARSLELENQQNRKMKESKNAEMLLKQERANDLQAEKDEKRAQRIISEREAQLDAKLARERQIMEQRKQEMQEAHRASIIYKRNRLIDQALEDVKDAEEMKCKLERENQIEFRKAQKKSKEVDSYKAAVLKHIKESEDQKISETELRLREEKLDCLKGEESRQALLKLKNELLLEARKSMQPEDYLIDLKKFKI